MTYEITIRFWERFSDGTPDLCKPQHLTFSGGDINAVWEQVAGHGLYHDLGKYALPDVIMVKGY